MTKAELIEAVAKSAKITKLAAGEAVDATFDGIAKAIRKNKRFGSRIRHLYRALTQGAQGHQSADRGCDQYQSQPHRRLQSRPGAQKGVIVFRLTVGGHRGKPGGLFCLSGKSMTRCRKLSAGEMSEPNAPIA